MAVTARVGVVGHVEWVQFVELPALPGPPADSYGCGDAFAAGLTFGLARGLGAADAIRLGAECGARCLTLRGPYG